MLEKPDLNDRKIVACLRDMYGLAVEQVAFLPLGADLNTAVYCAVAGDGIPYFVKLRRGIFDPISVTLPKLFYDQGVSQIIAPLATETGQLWADLDAFKLILYPFVDGRNGYEVGLSDRQWVEFGSALKRIHTAAVPASLAKCIRQETYPPWGRDTVKSFLARVEDNGFASTLGDPVAVEMAELMRAKSDAIFDLVGHAERLARALQAEPREYIACHSDIHAANIHIAANETFYIVDWDDPIMAPKERDLMYVGGGLMGAWRTPQEEETLFYRGYGQTQIDPAALAYYRYERIVQDIAVYCEQIFLNSTGDQDREQSLQYLASNFLPNNTIEIAYKSDKTVGLL
ncbi:MAG: phosphotransferase [Anaerolineae bacterium]|nr:phosphotransferase [Anaerolineae bacterium]